MQNNGLINREYVNTFLKNRETDMHKGDCGRLLVIAGSWGMAGAAILCGRAALRSGAGLVQISVPEELFPILQAGVPEATCLSRDIQPEDILRYDAVAVGPGLGKEDANVDIIRKVLQTTDKTVVLDADGLNLLSENPSLVRGRRAPLILTPHPGEAGRLLHMTAAEVNRDRQSAACRLAAEYDAVAVLKGSGTVVAMPEGKTYINTTGNPGMATGGSGDVLTGVIAALTGQGYSPWEAAVAGVYLHGLAGDLMAQKLGEYGLIASDLVSMVAVAIRETVN